jgi:hypothetical protein
VSSFHGRLHSLTFPIQWAKPQGETAGLFLASSLRREQLVNGSTRNNTVRLTHNFYQPVLLRLRVHLQYHVRVVRCRASINHVQSNNESYPLNNYLLSSALETGTVMKHLVMNSASSCRALDDCAFLRIFLRLNPRRPPPVLNFRMFSRLRFSFSFLAFTRQASREVADLALNVKGTNANRGVMACVKKCQ